MPIPESQLEIWSHQGSVTQSAATYGTVRAALESKYAKYAAKSCEVFLQGSYGNDTNIYAESDVDVVIRTAGIYHYDISELTPAHLQTFIGSSTPPTFTYAEYKSEVVEALQKSFGKSDVNPAEKAVKIKASGNRRSSDVIVATEFRRYYSGPNGLAYTPGITFFTTAGKQINNYPKLHSANLTNKHKATYQWLKPMARILKNMRGRLVADRLLGAGDAPSYFIEGLLFNVPDGKFGTTYGDTFVAAMNWILESNERSKFVTPSGQHWLIRDNRPESWPSANCEAFINSVVRLWNEWR